MTIETRSKFYYDFTVNDTKTDIIFDEGNGELTATLELSQYSPTKLAVEVARVLTETGTQDYFCVFDRDLRTFTISSTNNFSLLISTGVTASSAYTLLGFVGVDKTGFPTYSSDVVTGKVFLPQFRLQNYVDFIDDEGFSFATTKKTANGQVEVVSFGNESFSEFNIIYQTNTKQGFDSPIEEDLNGVSNMREFFRYAIKKGSIDFMKDRSDSSNFVECILEKTPKSKDGTAYKLKEMYSRNLINYFESGLIKLRKL